MNDNSRDFKEKGIDFFIFDKEERKNGNKKPFLGVSTEIINLNQDSKILRKNIMQDVKKYIKETITLHNTPCVKLHLPVDLITKLEKSNKKDLINFLDFIKEDIKTQLSVYLLIFLESVIGRVDAKAHDDYLKNKEEHFAEKLMSVDDNFEDVVKEIENYTAELGINAEGLNNLYHTIHKLNLIQIKTPTKNIERERYINLYNHPTF